MSFHQWPVALALATVCSLCGCGDALHNLQPHRLHRLNRGPDLERSTSNFHVPETFRPTTATQAEIQQAITEDESD